MLFNFLNVDRKTKLVLTTNLPVILEEIGNIKYHNIQAAQPYVCEYFESLGTEEALNRFAINELMNMSEEELVAYILDSEVRHYFNNFFITDLLRNLIDAKTVLKARFDYIEHKSMFQKDLLELLAMHCQTTENALRISEQDMFKFQLKQYSIPNTSDRFFQVITLEDLERVKYYYDQFNDLIEEVHKFVNYQNSGVMILPTEEEFIEYGSLLELLYDNDFDYGYEELLLWFNHGFDRDLSQLEDRVTDPKYLFNNSFPGYKNYTKYDFRYYESIGNIGKPSVMEGLKGYWFLEEDEGNKKWVAFCLTNFEELEDKQEIVNILLEGKHRMIKRKSRHIYDLIESYGLTGLAGIINKHEVNDARKFINTLRNGEFKPNTKRLNQIKDNDKFNRFKLAHLFLVFGEAYLNVNSYMLNHLEYCTFEIPEHMKKSLANNQKLFSWVYENGLAIDFTVSKSLKVCVLEAIKTKYNLDDKGAELVFECSSALQALDFVKHNQQTVESDTLPEANFEFDGWTLTKLSKNDLMNLTMGDFTACCQKLGGYGEDVCIEGWNDPNSVNYVIKSSSGNTYAHFWAWKAEDGTIVIDSVEGRKSMSVRVVTQLVSQFVQANKDLNIVISNTAYGLTEGVVHCLRETHELTATESPTPIMEYTYMDGDEGVYTIS